MGPFPSPDTAAIKASGQDDIKNVISDRLGASKKIQLEIDRRPDLLLLSDTDIVSYMFIFAPQECQKRAYAALATISVADLDKLNEINTEVKVAITQLGKCYLDGLTLKRCSHRLIEDGRSLYVFRNFDNNLAITLNQVQELLHSITSLGHQYLTEHDYKVLPQPRTSLHNFLSTPFSITA